MQINTVIAIAQKITTFLRLEIALGRIRGRPEHGISEVIERISVTIKKDFPRIRQIFIEPVAPQTKAAVISSNAYFTAFIHCT
jgi:hypothetical protein